MTREEAIQAIKAKMDYYESDKRLRAAIETLIPELKESEDERIRNELIDALKTSKSVGELKFILPEPTREECIAYLEKQKDASKAIEAVERIDKYIGEHLANAHDMKDSNPDKKYYRGWDDALGKMSGILQDVYSNENQKKEKANLTKEQFIKYGELEYQRGYLQGVTEGYNKAMKEKEIPLMNGDADLYFDNFIESEDDVVSRRKCFEEGMRYAQRLKLNTVEQNSKLKFKIGDKVHFPSDCVNTLTITGLQKDRYLTDSAYGPILFSRQDEFELVEDDNT